MCPEHVTFSVCSSQIHNPTPQLCYIHGKLIAISVHILANLTRGVTHPLVAQRFIFPSPLVVLYLRVQSKHIGKALAWVWVNFCVQLKLKGKDGAPALWLVQGPRQVTFPTQSGGGVKISLCNLSQLYFIRIEAEHSSSRGGRDPHLESKPGMPRTRSSSHLPLCNTAFTHIRACVFYLVRLLPIIFV